MFNEMLEVVINSVISKLLDNESFLRQVSARINVQAAVNVAVEQQLEDAVQEHVSKCVEECIADANIEQQCEDAVEVHMRNFEITSEQVSDFEEAVRETIKGAL